MRFLFAALSLPLLVACAPEGSDPNTTGSDPSGLSKGDKADQPVSLGPTYSVIAPPEAGVALRDIPSLQGEVIGRLDPLATEVAGTGNTIDNEGIFWIEVSGAQKGKGWVDGSYLTESVDLDSFCADDRAWDAIADLASSVSTVDGAGFPDVLSPRHGLWVRVTPDGDGVHLSSAEAWATLMDLKTEWGTNPQNDSPVVGTFSEVGLTELRDVLASQQQDLRCNRYPQGVGRYFASIPDPLGNLNFVTVSVAYDGAWLTWAVGIDYVDETPYVTYLVRLGRDDAPTPEPTIL